MEVGMKSSQDCIFALALTLMLFCLPCAAAQQQGSRDGSAPPTTAPGAPQVGQQTASSSAQKSMQQRVQESYVLFGDVLQEDGTPPPFGSKVELTCGNSPLRVVPVDIKGHFMIEVGGSSRPSSLIPDASQSGNSSSSGWNPLGRSSPDPELSFFGQTAGSLANTRLMGCDLRAQLPGYKSSILLLNGGLFSGPNEVGTIFVYPNERVRGVTVSVASMLAPKSARKSRERALKAFRKEKFDEAEELLNAAIKDYANYSEAWFDLGRVSQKQGRNQAARDAYAKSIEIDKLFVSPYIELAWLSLSELKWQEAADLTERALALDPISFPEIYYMNALANLELNRLDIAEKSARQEQRLDSHHRIPQVSLILATILSKRNDAQGTINQLQDYLKYAPNAKDAPAVRSVLDQVVKDAKNNVAKNR